MKLAQDDEVVADAYRRLVAQLDALGSAIICNGSACRLLDDEFMTRLELWYGRLGDKFQCIVVDELVCRLMDDLYMESMELWFILLGGKFQTFINGSVVWLLDEAFVAATGRWINLVGIGTFVTIFSNPSFVSRLMKKKGFE
jgi:hypothetical protein